MMIEKIRDNIIKNMGVPVKFRINGSRNQNSEFSGEIINAYKAVFTIKKYDDNLIQSFSYADVLIGNLVIEIDA